MRQTDKAWSLVLGNEEDKEAKAFLQTNKGDLFKVKNQQEFNNGTTNGDTLVADLAGSDFTKIKNFTKENTQKTTKESLEKQYVSDLGDRVVDTAAQAYEGVKNLPETTKKVAEGVIMALTGVTAVTKAGLKKVLLPGGDKKLDNIARDNKVNTEFSPKTKINQSIRNKDSDSKVFKKDKFIGPSGCTYNSYG